MSPAGIGRRAGALCQLAISGEQRRNAVNATADPAISAKVTAVSKAVGCVGGGKDCGDDEDDRRGYCRLQRPWSIVGGHVITTTQEEGGGQQVGGHCGLPAGWNAVWVDAAVLLRLGARQPSLTCAQMTQKQARSPLRAEHCRRTTFPARGAQTTLL